MQKTFFELIRQENQNGATVLLSSHILPEVQKLCSRVAIIKEGRIVKLEDIGTLRNTTYKKIRIEFSQGVPDGLAGEPGVSAFHGDNGEASFLFAGDVNAIVQRISTEKLKNLTIEEPDLEEIFMHYYTRNE